MLVKILKDPTDPTWIDPSTVVRVEVHELSSRWWFSKPVWWVEFTHSVYPWKTYLGDYDTEAEAIAAVDSWASVINRA